MKDGDKIKEQLINELVELRQRITELEALETERKQAEEKIQQRTAQLEALRQVGLELTAQLDLDTLLHSIASRAIELLQGNSGGLYLYRPEQDVLEWAVAIGPNLAPPGTVLLQGEGLSGRVWETSESLIVNDYQDWEGKAVLYEGYPWTAVVGVPVRWGEEFLGVLDVLADSPRTFSWDDAELLGLLATQAAIAIQNARLFEQEREQQELAEALEEAAAVVSSTLDLDQVLDHILEQVERVVAGEAFSVILIEEDVARLARWRGYEMPGEEIQPSRFDIPIAEYPNLMEMARTGKPVVVPDTSVDSDWVPAARDQGWRRSYVGAPIQVGSATAGFLNVSGIRPGQFGPEDARRLQAFASHAATAIGNARLYGEAQQELADRKRAEEALRESEERFRQMAELSPFPVSIIDPAGRYEYVNPKFIEVFGYTLEDIPNSKEWFAQAYPDPGYRQEVISTWQSDLEQFGEYEVRPRTFSVTCKDGTVREILFRPITKKDGGQFVISEDITERKQVEEERRQYTAELEARNEELDAFAHTVAHDLKGPLALLLGYADVLEEDYALLSGQKLQEYSHMIMHYGRKMSSIVDELLLLAEVRKMEEVTIERLNMANIVAEAQGRVIYLIKEHQAEIILPDTWPVALGYGSWVEEVWVNYLSNAIQYGGWPPCVELGATEQADGMVRFWVRDNGPGLTPGEQARLFTPFTQLAQARAKGHGLGLSIVRRIVEKLGGQVGVESEVGRGSVFTFTLPGMAS
jgi:PAS domain S-box-containing protein